MGNSACNISPSLSAEKSLVETIDTDIVQKASMVMGL